MESLKINKLEIENVKRIKAVKIEPTPNGLTIVGGNNNQGKTSVLDSIAWALGGEKYRPSEAQRHGSVIPPNLHIVMNNGLVVERKGKNSSLSVSYYRLEGKMLIYDMDQSMDQNGPVAHYRNGEEWNVWNKVPFIPFKNNQIETPDIQFVKTLLDGYDLSRSEAANYVEEVKNLIFVLKGYGGQDLSEFMKQINEDRAIPIDDPEEGGVDTITPTMDITALREHYEQLKRDLTEDGQSVNKDLDKFGAAPSGVALKFMYSGLDLKCNLMEAEFKIAFETLLYFVDEYLQITGKGSFENIEVELVFNRDMAVNQAEQIQNCTNSKGTVSDKTIIAHHPFVSDVEEELKALEEQREAEGPAWDIAPSVRDDGDGEE